MPSLSPSSANPRIIESLYGEALALADQARAEFEQMRCPPAGHGSPEEDLAQVQASCEALRTTTRIMHCLAWLLNHRAWFAGELSELQLRRHGRLIAHFPASDPAIAAALPAPARQVVLASERLYQRIDRLEQAWRQGAQAQPPAQDPSISHLHERLTLALARTG